jgi:uncharacterized membrane protein YqjE
MTEPEPQAEQVVPEEVSPVAPAPHELETHPARELSMHLLRMLETRMDAAGIAIQGETQLVLARLQLRMLAGAAAFFAVWGGIVLLAIALPPDLRVPVLGVVVAAFVIVALVAYVRARRPVASQQVGSLRWFMDSLRQDLEVLSRALAGGHNVARGNGNGNGSNGNGSTRNDLAA